jgi:hypothetical protein
METKYAIEDEVVVITSESQLEYARMYKTKVKGFSMEKGVLMYQFENGYNRKEEDVFEGFEEAKNRLRNKLEERLAMY